MIFNLQNNIEVKQAKTRLEWLIEHGKRVEITEKRYSRTNKQNKYLHVVLSFYGTQTGYTLEEVKQDIFKRDICREWFVYEKDGRNVCRSTSDLDTKEMIDVIERFRNHASADLGFYIPEPHEEEFLRWCEDEIEKHKIYL